MLAIFGALPVEIGKGVCQRKADSHKIPPRRDYGAGIGYLPEERRSDAIFPGTKHLEPI
jgi:ABC-type sugar transport system ATPase subunit